MCLPKSRRWLDCRRGERLEQSRSALRSWSSALIFLFPRPLIHSFTLHPMDFWLWQTVCQILTEPLRKAGWLRLPSPSGTYSGREPGCTSINTIDVLLRVRKDFSVSSAGFVAFNCLRDTSLLSSEGWARWFESSRLVHVCTGRMHTRTQIYTRRKVSFCSALPN